MAEGFNIVRPIKILNGDIKKLSWANNLLGGMILDEQQQNLSDLITFSQGKIISLIDQNVVEWH